MRWAYVINNSYSNPISCPVMGPRLDHLSLVSDSDYPTVAEQIQGLTPGLLLCF